MRTLLLCAALVGLPVATASAEGPSAAEVLFREGKTLLDSGQLEQACRVLEESNRLEPAGGTLLNLASCYERLGRYASAERALTEARRLAEDAGRDDAKKFIEQRLGAIAPNVSILRVNLGERQPTRTTLEVDNVTIELKGSTTELRLDPGPHELRVETEGLPVWRHKLTLEGAGATADVEVGPVPAPVPTPLPVEPKAVVVKPMAPPVATGLGPFEITGIVGLAVGGGMLLAGGVIGGLAIDAWSEASERCPQPDCTDEGGVARSQDAVSFGNTATGLLVSGAVVALAGGAFLLIGKLQSSARANAWRTPTTLRF